MKKLILILIGIVLTILSIKSSRKTLNISNVRPNKREILGI